MLPVLIVLLAASASPITVDGKKHSRCEEISIPMCRDIGYNYTSMPNQFNHDTQEEAGLEVHQFWPLVEIQCSSDLKFFLCSMYVPICIDDYMLPLPACRSVCERAKAGCSPLMGQYGFAWPERMNCDKLPEYGDHQQLCMDSKNGSEAEKPTPYPKQQKSNPNTIGGGGQRGSRGRNNNSGKGMSSTAGKGKSAIASTSINGKVVPSNCECNCNMPLVALLESSKFYNKVVTGGVSNCAVSCDGFFFAESEKTFAKFWIGLWSILCLLSTLMTVTTFLIDIQRFKYPERPIIFVSGCYMMVSIGYILPLIIGSEHVACDGDIIRYNSTSSAACSAVFLLIYFFGMASAIWWVILALTWFLAAGLKWGNEAIASYCQYYHLAAWLIPSIKSIVILATSAVDGDPLSGICYVGNLNVDYLREFVIAPLIVYLILGTIFLLAGFVSLFRIHNAIKQQGPNKTEKLVKLMIKIGLFSLFYIVPAVIIICCYYYEQYYRELWEQTHNCSCVDVHKPDFWVFILKYFMCLSVGITSGLWIWSSKTVYTWKKCYANLCGKNAYTQHDIRTCHKKPNMYSVSHSNLQKPIPLSHV